MVFLDTKTLEEDRLRFIDLRTKFHELMTRYGYSDNDARVMILNNCCRMIISVTMFMNILISLDKKIIKVSDAQKLLGVEEIGDFHTLMTIENDLRRISFLTTINFQIETLFKILLSALEEKPETNFSKVSKQIVKRLNVSNPDTKISILNTIAYIRNCLHANGVHNKQSQNILVDGFTFKFEKGKSFGQAKWAHIHFLMDNVYSILEEILDSVEIQSIPDPLPDTYSS